MINIHEEINEDDSVLPIRVRRKKGKLKCWKVGWIEAIDDKMSERKIEIIETEEKELVKTTNKFLMEHAIEWTNEKKDKL